MIYSNLKLPEEYNSENVYIHYYYYLSNLQAQSQDRLRNRKNILEFLSVLEVVWLEFQQESLRGTKVVNVQLFLYFMLLC